MPIRWTADADQTLLLKILETQDLIVDFVKVAAAWPGPAESRPTPRAIKERLFKIKENARDTTGLAQPSPSPRKGRKPATKSTTPKKAGVKRKRVSTPSPIFTEDEGKYIAEDTLEYESLDQRVKPTETSRDVEEDSDGEV
ncbi:hypothetical protein N7448_007145 [Penicillium atrosanguineum]|uniref:Uncharacterized protein n=1 Tax=Penicillium atrosanguineum TaxID=1132637 RepID=A0A9W9GZM1_9EURO|nr:Actin-related protein 2/3 complex subunit 2 [Penicillium atrosanguineum]KAJ5132987.1 hypothetical protein N7448_007145 [Penicillium atrosanguineum]KAJ5141120.1 hypothetical protein N7526_002115 [Penicillium atrosanguineum]KAJ5290655.1 Actin-related protein 2/3 complex subunit 2 [Penicillium atrosanguineum]KAJ5308478.1 hypothetical protein N7476_009134 [Penicillium atrosanguineum]